MKITERINKKLIKKQQDGVIVSINDVFVNSLELFDYITDSIKHNKNIIFICNKSFDKYIISDYFKILLKDMNVRILENIDVLSKDLDNFVNIIPNPDIKSILKIFEQIIYGFGTFIFCMNFASYENIVNKLKAVISLNQQNLSSENIETLIGSSNLSLVYILKNNDGLLYISKIEEIKTNNYILETVTIMENKDKKLNIQNEEIEQEIENSERILKDKQEKSIVSDFASNGVLFDDNKETKPNKYQILKERAKQKKLMKKDINQKV